MDILAIHKPIHDIPHHTNNQRFSSHPRGYHRHAPLCRPKYVGGNKHHGNCNSLGKCYVGKLIHHTLQSIHKHPYDDHTSPCSNIRPKDANHSHSPLHQPKQIPSGTYAMNNLHQSIQLLHPNLRNTCNSYCIHRYHDPSICFHKPQHHEYDVFYRRQLHMIHEYTKA